MPKSSDDTSKMSKDLIKAYSDTVTDLNKSYINGMSFCLAGLHGTGKTMTVTNILKKAAQKNFTALYTTLSDIVSSLTLPSSEDKFATRKELTEVDFLVIDEFDPRFTSTENSADLFGRSLEHILRTRLQNKLPVIMVSNSPNPVETFNGSLKQSIESLMSTIPFYPILGQDYRKVVLATKIKV